MKTITLMLTALLMCLVSLAIANETPKPDEFEKQHGFLFRISDEAGAKLTDPVEKKLHSIKIPEAVFAQANISDVLEFLKNASGKDNKGISIVLGKGVSEADPPLITFAARNVSVLEVIKFITSVADLKHTIKNGSVVLAKKEKSK